MTLSDVSIKNPVFAWMLMIGILVFGWIGFTRLGVSQLPDIDFPIVTVNIAWEGAAPEVMERRFKLKCVVEGRQQQWFLSFCCFFFLCEYLLICG
ncbi:MAG: hypothetical protein AUJ71_04120 [Candidatus Omnitrophica bacterium CG1_02_49_16]|nr:MAG: hypothetical protein AUJ71_04120 [Candidatus Omnitrophica bacterium CG1_02_49_16]